jgi:hypothetical protein
MSITHHNQTKKLTTWFLRQSQPVGTNHVPTGGRVPSDEVRHLRDELNGAVQLEQLHGVVPGAIHPHLDDHPGHLQHFKECPHPVLQWVLPPTEHQAGREPPQTCLADSSQHGHLVAELMVHRVCSLTPALMYFLVLSHAPLVLDTEMVNFTLDTSALASLLLGFGGDVASRLVLEEQMPRLHPISLPHWTHLWIRSAHGRRWLLPEGINSITIVKGVFRFCIDRYLITVQWNYDLTEKTQYIVMTLHCNGNMIQKTKPNTTLEFVNHLIMFC